MDESLLSARELEIPSSGQEGPVRLTIEDWLALANPGLGFFTVPDGAQTWSDPEPPSDGIIAVLDRIFKPFPYPEEVV